MNVCVVHLQMNVCVAKNFGAWTEKFVHPCPTLMAHPTRVGRRVGALHKKLGHPCSSRTRASPTIQLETTELAPKELVIIKI